jgi:hypothetical protein
MHTLIIVLLTGCHLTSPWSNPDHFQREAAWTAPAPALGLGTAAVLADFDGDGAADLAIGNPVTGEVLVYPSNGTTELGAAVRLTTAGAETGRALAALDANDDGYMDLAIGEKGGVALHRGGPDGLEPVAGWTLAGDPAVLGADFGAVLASAGDLNNDGADELLVGAPEDGRAQLFLGSPGGLSIVPAWDVTTVGSFGAAVAGVGDINGDGRDDFAVGAPDLDAAAPGAGAVFLYYGAAAVAVAADWRLDGDTPQARLGASIAGGDVDGDGVSDLMLGASGRWELPSTPGRGRLSVHYGGPFGPSTTPDWTAELGTELRTDTVAGLGTRLAGGGDLNDDGLADMLVSDGTGWVFAYHGRPGGPSSWPAWAVRGFPVLAMGGDVEGDGFADVFLADPDLGLAALYVGTDAPIDDDGDGVANERDCASDDSDKHPGALETCDWIDADCDGDLADGALDADEDAIPNCVDLDHNKLFSWSASGGPGYGSSATAGDFNGDGLDDLAVSAAAATLEHEGEGAVFVHLAAGHDAAPDWAIFGGAEGAALDALAAADWNGDGYDDLLVGVPGLEDGAARLYFGGPGGLSVWHDWEWIGDAVVFGVGSDVASAGDMDDDGYIDALVGAGPSHTALLFRGSAAGLGPAPVWQDTQSGNYGATVAGVGDVNGDGPEDFVVGAPTYNLGAGRAYYYAGDRIAVGSPVTFDGAGDARFGASISPGGDMDGDLLSDFGVGAPLAFDGVGTVRTYRGDPTGPVEARTLLGDGEATRFGAQVERVDHDGDGLVDLVVGTPGGGRGQASLFLASPTGVAGTPALTWRAGGDTVAFGSALATGWINEDGHGDVVITDPSQDPNGRAYLFYGDDDADDDGLSDTLERDHGLDPADPDSDADGIPDGEEFDHGVDSDGDGVIDALDIDSDDDGVLDGGDNCRVDANPDQADGDHDGIGDVCDDVHDTGLEPMDTCIDNDIDTAYMATVTVTDIGAETGFQDTFLGHHKRGRSTVAADFDLDGRVDFFMGNPSDESFILRNVDDGAGGARFELHQVLLEGHLSWGAAAADYDNDGDFDLYVAGGGNECRDFDKLFRNDFIETGLLHFTDVSAEAGIEGPAHPVTGAVTALASANGAWGDFDGDGDNDLFVATNPLTGCATYPAAMSRNVLWENLGDGTFRDVTLLAGLSGSLRPSRHPTWVDLDNDGDLDLYEMNYKGPNHVWRNNRLETGTADFTNVTTALSAGGANLARTWYTFAACAEDFDNDGWQDIITFHRGGEDCTGAPAGAFPGVLAEDVVGTGHQLFLNREGAFFEEVAVSAGLNTAVVDSRVGVMGSQIGDLNADGVLDVYVGNGGPIDGEPDQLFLSEGSPGDALWYWDASALVDFPAPDLGEVAVFPAYPYRTHGTVFADIDDDGTMELAVNNGGPSFRPDSVQEPNRMFRFEWEDTRHYFKVRVWGDGTLVPRDGVGTRVRVVGIAPDGSERSVWRTVHGGSCFSAQNGFELYFGLGDAIGIDRIEVYWLDGTMRTLSGGLVLDDRIEVTY